MSDNFKITVPQKEFLTEDEFKKAMHDEGFSGQTILADVIEVQEEGKPSVQKKSKFTNNIQGPDSISHKISMKINAIRTIDKRVKEYNENLKQMRRDLKKLEKMAIEIQDL